jgi:hypothetical protein
LVYNVTVDRLGEVIPGSAVILQNVSLNRTPKVGDNVLVLQQTISGTYKGNVYATIANVNNVTSGECECDVTAVLHLNGPKGDTGATGPQGPAGTDGHSVYTATDTCSTEVGVECEVYKDSTNAKGVGDVIINANGRVFTVTGEDVHEGKPTWTGPVTAIINGPQGPEGPTGPRGPAGPAGSDASITSFGIQPVTRVTPTADGIRCEIRAEINGSPLGNLGNMYLPIEPGENITFGANAANNRMQIKNAIKLYQHNIKFNQSGTITAHMSFISKSMVKLSRVDELNSQLVTLVPYPMTGWYRENSNNLCWAICVVATSGGGVTLRFCGNSGETAVKWEPDETITDDVVNIV